MSKMTEEVHEALTRAREKAKAARDAAHTAFLAAEDAHIAAENAESLFLAASFLERKECRTALQLEVELTAHEPDLTWREQSLTVDVPLDVCGKELTLSDHKIELGSYELDCLTPSYAVACFPILDLVKAIAEVLRDDAACDEERAQSIQAITNELRKQLLD